MCGVKIGDVMGKVGRPKNFKVSQVTKDRISRSKMGKRHTPEAREKISQGLMRFYRRKNTLERELQDMYSDVAGEWLKSNQEALNAPGCGTLSQMRSMNRKECPVGNFIEVIAYDNRTPEFLVLLKEELENEDD